MLDRNLEPLGRNLLDHAIDAIAPTRMQLDPEHADRIACLQARGGRVVRIGLYSQ
ncbi:hypothetical protein D3C84_945270 [compost metagenome]